MSTATLSAPHLEITAPDTMDLHSDSGLDFGDGDIDLDLRSTGGLDDDVSLGDAATDAGQDVQTASGDQDDFMVDNEDLIEEDVDDEDVEVLEQPAPAGLEEDLIDYSDEEDAAVDDTPVVADAHQDDIPDGVAAGDDEENPAVDDPPYTGEHVGEDEAMSQYAADTHDHGDLVPVQDQDSVLAQQPGEQVASQEQNQSQYDVHVEAETSTDATHSLERRISESINDTGAEDVSNERSGEDVPQVNFHPVNVHFDGHDYWLFKHHDYEGSGDYLLEDDAFFKQPVHTVINACREALRTLGADVSNDLELGFCLDSLHSVELYEEHPTCHFFNLNDILCVYLQLYAQDGITDPEYFCITLLSRPRISSLLAELSKAAAEGIGYSGLNNAIASGQTVFSAHYSHNSPKQGHEEWEEGDEQEEPAMRSNLQAGDQDDHEENYQDAHEHENVYVQREEEEPQEKHGKEASESAADKPEEEATAAVTTSDDVTTEDAAVNPNKNVEQSISNTMTSDQNPQGLEADLLDYSDDEYNEAPDNEVQATQSSSDSATVQGDDPPQPQGNIEDVTQSEQQGDQADGAEVMLNGQASLGDEAFAEYEGHSYSCGEYDGQTYGEEYDGEYGQDYNEGQEFEGYPAYDAAQADDENTNYIGDLGQHSPGNADDTNVTAGMVVGDPDAVDEIFEGANDLDFDDKAAAAQQLEKEHAAEDQIDYSDEEDGAVSQAPVAASAAADTVATSSSGLENLSPQRQKRTIDEVGNDVVDATNATDAKRPRV